jgi:D-tyrosyl-tRNA(Tyr) deacylase
MRVLLQRVTQASVTVDGRITGAIDHGLVLLIGVGQADEPRHADRLADKVVNLRIFNDDDGKFNRSLLDVGGGALVVSQFTLFADSRKGRRPGFTDAAPPDVAKPLCEYFADKLRQLGVGRIGCGVFGAHMDVEIHNDGPVTIWLDTDVIGV